MRVPVLLVLTDRTACAPRDLPDVVAEIAAAGAPALLYREKDLPAAERRRLGERVAAAIADTGTALVVASDPDLADHLDADAVHLAATDPTPRHAREFGRSCHDLDELTAAREEGAAYATVSPVFPSAAKPGYGPALKLGGLADLARRAGNLPVVALGGIDPARALACLAAGATGVAVQHAVMAARAPGAAVAEFLQMLDAEPEHRP